MSNGSAYCWKDDYVRFLVVIAAVQLRSHWASIMSENNQYSIPFPVVLLWLILSFELGGGLERRRIPQQQQAAKNDDQEVPTAMKSPQQQPPPPDEDEEGSNKNVVVEPVWTNLARTSTRKSQHWEVFETILVQSDAMTNALSAKVPKEQRKSLAQITDDVSLLKQLLITEEEEEEEDDQALMGHTVEDPERLRAKSLEQDYVQPICPLRGIDIFLADCAEADLARHSYLIENGLRDRPTFCLNLMTSWGNVALYFELPKWVQDWDNLPLESESDSEATVALKRWLNGDDAYRAKRLKVLPVLVDGPTPIKWIAPPRSTVQVVRKSLPATWTKHPAQKDKHGNITQHCCFELDCDLMFTPGMRNGAGLIKRYLGSIVGDCALLIEQPYLQKEDEPRACIGMCRFDRIDISSCPNIPPRLDQGKTEEERDMFRASILTGQPLPSSVMAQIAV